MGEEPTTDVKAPEADLSGIFTETEDTTPEPSTEEPTEAEEPESKDEEPTEAESEPEASEDETPEEPPKRSAEARKQELSQEIRQLASQKRDLAQEVARLNAEVYQPQTVEELVEAGEDPTEARVIALEQRTQMAEYNAFVSDLNSSINAESLQVMADFPVFDSQSESYDPTLAARAAAVWQKAAGMKTDEKTGLVTQANVLPYEIYKAFAETAQSSVKNGQAAGQKAAEKMMAAAETPSLAAPKQAAPDPFLTGFMRGL